MNTLPIKKSFGFTLIELLITLMITAILGCAAMISWTHLSQRSHAKNLTHQILSAIQTARSEAISRQQRVNLCVSAQGLGLEKEVLLFTLPSSYHLDWRGNFGVRDCITFLPYGGTDGQRGSLRILKDQALVARLVIVDSGRVKVEETESFPLASPENLDYT
jgi:prepilin-type N-terminal cleavage/methylation domain-containing protein